MLKLLLIPLFLYLALLVLLYAFQTRLLFPAGLAKGSPALPPAAQALTLAAPGGETLRGVHIPPASPRAGAPIVLGFGGNAWNAGTAADYLHRLYPETDVVAFHFRGYAPSTGTPSAAALKADALLIHDELARRFPGRPLVAVGFSIGSGAAAYLASERRLAGLILVTPFDALEKVAAGHYPWLPVRLLFRHPMPAAEWLRESQVPAAILAAERDTLIPAARTDALRKAVPNLVFDRTIRAAGHNDVYDRAEFQAAMREALRAIIER